MSAINTSVADDATSLSNQEFYNLLVAESWSQESQLKNCHYMLVVDCRDFEAFEKSHVIGAKHYSCLHNVTCCWLHVSGQLDAYGLIIIYDDVSQEVAKNLKQQNVQFFELTSNYKSFSKQYPFLCFGEIGICQDSNQPVVQTFPSEVIEGKLYQGSAKHAVNDVVMNNLRITHVVNITLEQPAHSSISQENCLCIRLADVPRSDLLKRIPRAVDFIASALESDGRHRVLVHCNLGRSRSSTIVLAYLMKTSGLTLQQACDRLKDCRWTAKPNAGFLDQLLVYEKQLFGRQMSDFSNLPV